MKTFNTIVFIALLALIASAPAHAATPGHDMQNMHADHGAMAPANQSTPETAWIDGVVKKIDKATGKITVSHGPLTNLNMPAMTMAFRVKDANWIDQVKEGGKIRFVADAINGTLTIIQLESAK